MVELELPFPPTVNTYYTCIKSRKVLSAKGRQYAKDVGKLCIGLRDSFPAGRLCVAIHIHPPTRQKRDIDNYIKAVFDAVTKACVWGDDEQVDTLHVYRREIVKGGAVKVIIGEIIE